VTFDPDFKVTTFFEGEYLKNGRFRDKVTRKHQQETMPSLSNGITSNDLE